MPDEIMYGSEHIMLALTPMERWSAAREMNSSSVFEHWLVIGTAAMFLVLVVLLIWVGYRRRQSHGQKKEIFTENAVRRGLGARDRQILLAIVTRSGLRRTQDVFTAADAFDRGAMKLLTACARTRTPQESDQLKAEVVRLREKLGFQIASPVRGAAALGRPSSRQIPVGKRVDLMGSGLREGIRIHGNVVRNDEIELAIELAGAVETRAGDPWRARYFSGLSAWEFETATVNCEGRKLILNHSDEVNLINRRRFPRVAVHGHALIAHLPFMRSSLSAVQAGPRIGQEFEQLSSMSALVTDPPAFVDGTLIELAGPGLLIETPLHAQPGDRVLVILTLDLSGDGAVAKRQRTITGIGRVRHCRGTDCGALVAVEFTGLSNAEIDELAYITSAISSIDDRNRRDENKTQGTPTRVAASV